MNAEQQRRSTINPPVFFTSAILVLLLVLYATVFQEHAQRVFEDADEALGLRDQRVDDLLVLAQALEAPVFGVRKIACRRRRIAFIRHQSSVISRQSSPMLR